MHPPRPGSHGRFAAGLPISLRPGPGKSAGGLAAEPGSGSLRLPHFAVHAAAGIVIAIVAVEPMPEVIAFLNGCRVAAGFPAAALASMPIDTVVERREGESGAGASSSTTTLGPRASRLAMTILCWLPPESSLAFCPAWPFTPNFAMLRSAMARTRLTVIQPPPETLPRLA